MKLRSKLAAAALAVTASAGLMIPAAPAAEAAYQVTCGSRTDWYRIINSTGEARCYATYGDAFANWSTLTISTGANSGYINYEMQRWGTYHDSPMRAPWFRGNFAENVRAVAVKIR